MDRGIGPVLRSNAFAAFSTILLEHAGRYLLLERAATKRFAPGRWTGLGGRVEPREFGDLPAAALRELAEETGLDARDVSRFALRRVLLHNQPGEPITLLVYFTGLLTVEVTPVCSEGTLHWVSEDEFAGLDIIENTERVLPLLIDDLARDPAGSERPRVGAAHYDSDGTLARILWA
jgi:8-oxo-dGTP diphosphatase